MLKEGRYMLTPGSNSRMDSELRMLVEFAKKHGFSLGALLSSLSWTAKCGIFILNREGFSVGGYLPEYIVSEPAEMLMHFGMLPKEVFKMLLNTGSAVINGSEHVLIGKSIPDAGDTYILLIRPAAKEAPEAEVSEYVLEYVQYRIKNLIGETADVSLLSQSLNDVLRGKIVDIDSIKAILMDERQKPYYVSFVVDFDDGIMDHRRYLNFINRLRELVIECKPTIFKGKMVVLLQAAPSEESQKTMIRDKWESSVFKPGYDYDSLNRLLASEKASACINAAIHDLSLLPDAVSALMEALEIAEKFAIDDIYDRIHRFDNYQTLTIEKLFFQQYLSSHSLSSLKLFIYPELIPLLNYDYQHQQNLTYVLYKYIVYGYDAGKTSKALFMHRNTVYNKIKQIQSIIGINFNNTTYMSMIMDSLKLYFFLTAYFNINIVEVMFGKKLPAIPKDTAAAAEEEPG